VLCTTVVHNDIHTREQFLQVSVGLGLVLYICLGLAFSCLAETISFPCCVRYSFFRDWLGRTFPKWPVLCRVGCKTFSQ